MAAIRTRRMSSLSWKGTCRRGAEVTHGQPESESRTSVATRLNFINRPQATHERGDCVTRPRELCTRRGGWPARIAVHGAARKRAAAAS
eukprot:2464464-Prymnesium_polylepis.1